MKEKKQENGLHILYKKLGETPYEVILRYKKENPETDILPMTYAGRLDPMAEGLLLVLSGEEVHNKDKYLDLPKEYEFEILWGFKTDTLDVLGLVENTTTFENPSEEKVKQELGKSVGKFEQTYPVYSSRPVGGKSLFQWAREGRIGEIDIPKHEVEIFDAKYVNRKKILREDLLGEIKNKVSLVKGDFRQQEILDAWEKVLSQTEAEEFVVDKISINVSSGFYVRQFVSDLAESVGIDALAFHIKRTKVGRYF